MNPPDLESRDEFDVETILVLEQLWRTAAERADKPCSIGRLSKQAALPMSTLRRTLTHMKSADLVEVSADSNGREFVSLTGNGSELCEALSAMSDNHA
ncbi:helix-turn-helix domain-containing protein [Paraburkholderia caledonica]|uniref:hypothetical protein n=1 Tax=Paraburkholderia caledonica TaxID=134536 RepID=UPI00036EAD9B|nr:hypothetical protein [Paraburkholderia caledonica]